MKKKERAVLVGAYFDYQEKQIFSDSMTELKLLADTANLDIVDEFSQLLNKPNPATYVGKGKLEEISSVIKEKEIHSIVFNNTLSPTQARNIAKKTKCNVVDRTELILDIFAKHARSKQSKLQVELAQLRYNYSRLRRMWSHLSRIEGGIGFRGPGEKQIELDRREISKKISILKNRLEHIKQTSKVKRKKRKSAVNISLVGYTNSGKSTLFNRLTSEKKIAADMLFATLESTTRAIQSDNSENVVITDTIGFIEKLPHLLVESFYSTLLDVREADLLVHMVDISDTNFARKIDSVNKVLAEIECDNKNILLVFNKIDKIDKTKRLFLQKKIREDHPHAVFISAKKGFNLSDLFERFNYFFDKTKKTAEFTVPVKLQKLVSFIYENSEVIKNDFDDSTKMYHIKTKIDRQLLPDIKEQIDNFKFLEQIK